VATQTSEKTPAERLLDALGPVDRYNEGYGDFGSPARMTMEEYLEPHAFADAATRLGPLEKVHLFWYAGMSCDGCSVAVTGAQAPTLEGLMMGAHPGLPRVVLHHPVLNLESGPAYERSAELAIQGTLDAPFVIVLEGSIADETIAYAQGGYWSGQGEEPWGPDGAERTVTAEEWIARMAPNAAAVVAIGTCATWGGIPSAAGNPTGAMSLMDFLGQDYRSTFGVPW
jgi:hydrogenase small subunit